ncbi:hypothetical protein O1611_g2450 [Lasiodiplodia mahajangana]|uniref:Uncharacterized protein n=1 Tax=Lasiodiplodia mahajangana TaxID=1108764 RepID=A0ACC2JUU2_9PEZI|nr:hypothetical protein O1611_g2450 [Lasiodiplodia mahajangana]
MASDTTTETVDASTSPNDKLQELQDSHSKILGLHFDATARLNRLERRVNKLDSGNESDSDTASEASDLDDDYTLGYEENVIPEVRDVDYEHFKNRYTEIEGKYCIEALVAGPDFEEQVRRELKRRDLLDQDYTRPLDNYDESDEIIIHRVRIQSPSILFLLHSVLEAGQANGSFLWKGQNRTTFFRPFTWFCDAQKKMKLKLEDLEKQFSHEPSSRSVGSIQTVAELAAFLEQAAIPGQGAPNIQGAQTSEAAPTAHSQNTTGTLFKSLAKRVERNVIERALLESYQTLLALRCYVEFVDKRIIPQATAYRNPDGPGPLSVRYQDLAYLFRAGELVYVPSFGNSECIGRIREIWKPDATSPGFHPVDFTACNPRRGKSRDGIHIFSVEYYRVDYNGDNYMAAYSRAMFPRFRGLWEVTSLPVYPLRYHPEREQISLATQECGRKFHDSTISKHMLYCGWSRVPPPPPPPPQFGVPKTTPTTNPRALKDIRDAAFHQVNYIESDVIVDVKEAIRAMPHWSPFYRPWSVRPFDLERWAVVEDSVEIIQWADRHRKVKLSSAQDRTQADDGIADLECAAFLAEDKFAGMKRDPDFTTEDLSLLPDRLYAYALRERKFFSGNTQSFFKIATGDDPFEHLKIDDKHIRIVKSVVWTHFQRKNTAALSGLESQMDQDLVRGKGRGLVILLHGAPGVGKTATAEAIALWHRKPLFVITCGDLGFTPQGVESSLSEIFRLAHLWDCILLLDEADVFLSQRETNALQRNALVSVFLRVLEYYNGILFLTTNRVGTLDEAFKSRVHFSLYYPTLGRSQTEQIMRLNLDRLEAIEKQRATSTSHKQLFIRKDDICKFAGEHWDRHSMSDGEGRWNGRQIRNAVQIATSLALYDRKMDQDQGAEAFPPVLDERHFEIVEQTMTLFEGYMNKTRGGSATFIAKQRSERDDRFQSPQPGLTRDQQYGPPSDHGVGGYTPYQARPQAPQFQNMPQSYPVAQHYPQHLSPSVPTRGSSAMPAPFVTVESTGIYAAQDSFRQATPQQMPSGVSLPFVGPSHVNQGSEYNAASSHPPGTSFPSQGQLHGSGAGHQGYETAN